MVLISEFTPFTPPANITAVFLPFLPHLSQHLLSQLGCRLRVNPQVRFMRHKPRRRTCLKTIATKRHLNTYSPILACVLQIFCGCAADNICAALHPNNVSVTSGGELLDSLCGLAILVYTSGQFLTGC